MKWVLRNLIRETSGQATTEYILLLAVVMTMLLFLIKKLIQPYLIKLRDALAERFNSTLFGADLHRIRLKR